MTSLRQDIRRSLQQFLEEHRNDEQPVEVLRIFQKESWLLQETEQMKDALRSDPFECLKTTTSSSLDRLLELLDVTDCHRVHTKSGYCNITVSCLVNSDPKMKSQGVMNGIELYFRYERQSQNNDDPMSPSVLYSISLARDHGPSEKLLWVEVYAEGHKPCLGVPPVNMMDDSNEEEWEDMDDVEEEVDNTTKPTPLLLGKRTWETVMGRTTIAIGETANNKLDEDGDEEMGQGPDRFIAGIDPDVLAKFLQWSNLGGEMADDLNAFYFLMTFPFYESEFDLPSYLLQGVFGPDDDEN